MAKTPLLDARRVLVGYGSDAASAVVPPISLKLAAGGVLAVVGANGTGKSTFLRAIAGELGVLGGDLLLWGRPIDERSVEFRREVAIVLDEDAYLPALTVREHLLLTARGHGVTAASDLVTEITEEFGIAGRAHAAPTALSSGQRRRLLLAAAFVRPRSVLLLDEPEQRLDAGMRDALAARLSADTATIVLATHDPVLVRACATRCLILADDQVRLASAEAGAKAIEEF